MGPAVPVARLAPATAGSVSPHGAPVVDGIGGGIDDVHGASLTNVTVAGNSAHGRGDGIDETGASIQAVETASVTRGTERKTATGR
jgi:hypothetical protein